MGLDKVKRTPCGFCFVLYHTREDAEAAVKYISGLTMDDRPIRVDFDWGFEEGRQFGRGRAGGQVMTPASLQLGFCLTQLSFSCCTIRYAPLAYSWQVSSTDCIHHLSFCSGLAKY